MKNTMPKKLLSAVTATAMLFALSACGNSPAAPEAQDDGAAGTILLSINPEIEVRYDEDGQVLKLVGVNKDGKSVVSKIPLADYEGKSCDEVMELLVTQIHKDGFFEKTVDGHTKNIVLKMEDGSDELGEGFLETVAAAARKAAAKAGIDASAIPVEEDDLDEQGRIGIEKARKLLLEQLDLSKNDVKFTESSYDLEDNVYEFELISGSCRYEYELDAITGKVTDADKEHNDDWDDRPNDKARISKREAKVIVLEKLDLRESDISDVRYDMEDNVYEIELIDGEKEYECEVDAETGAILEIDVDDANDPDDKDDLDDDDDLDDEDDPDDDDDLDDEDDPDDDDDLDDEDDPDDDDDLDDEDDPDDEDDLNDDHD